jgi:tellurite methyltransferase
MGNNKDFRERFDQKYQTNRDTFRNTVLPVVKQAMKYVSSGEALDLGAGNGRNTMFLISQSFNVTSVDTSKEGLKILEEKVEDKRKLKTVLSDVREFNTDKKFDIVIAIGLLHFLSKEDGKKLIENIQEWTKKGGVNVIGVKMSQNRRGDLPHTFEHNELRDYYDKENWEVKHYSENGVAFLIVRKTQQFFV